MNHGRKVRTHLPSFKFLQAKSSQRNPSDLEFPMRVKDFPTDFKTSSIWQHGFDTLTNRKLLGLKVTLYIATVLIIDIGPLFQQSLAEISVKRAYYSILPLFSFSG